MATCPNCSVSSRQDPGAFVIDDVLYAKPPGTFSLAGAQLKASAYYRNRLACQRCGWQILGYIDDMNFIADPTTERYPT